MKYIKIKEEEFETCHLEECNVVFKKTSHNRKFCSAEHTRIATNRKILKKYHDSKKPVKKGRVCKSKDCKTVLSIYNKTDYCNPCREKKGMI